MGNLQFSYISSHLVITSNEWATINTIYVDRFFQFLPKQCIHCLTFLNDYHKRFSVIPRITLVYLSYRLYLGRNKHLVIQSLANMHVLAVI